MRVISIVSSNIVGPDSYPFHGVRRRDLAELSEVVEDSGVGSVGKLGVVSGGTEVLLAGSLSELVQARAGGCGRPCGGGRGNGSGRRGRRSLKHGSRIVGSG